jgi:hypothetical protein
MVIRNAAVNDAEHLAFLINLAGEGLPLFLWRRMADPGQDPLRVGAAPPPTLEGAVKNGSRARFRLS